MQQQYEMMYNSVQQAALSVQQQYAAAE